MASWAQRVEAAMDAYGRALLDDGDTAPALGVLRELLLNDRTPNELAPDIEGMIRALTDAADPLVVRDALPLRPRKTHQPYPDLMGIVFDRYREIHDLFVNRRPPRKQEGWGSWFAAPPVAPPVATQAAYAPTPAETPARPKKDKREKGPLRFADSTPAPVTPATPATSEIPATSETSGIPATPGPSVVLARSFATMTEAPVVREMRGIGTGPGPMLVPPLVHPRAQRRVIVPDSLAPWWMPYPPPMVHPAPRPAVPYPTLPLWYLQERLNSQKTGGSHRKSRHRY